MIAQLGFSYNFVISHLFARYSTVPQTSENQTYFAVCTYAMLHSLYATCDCKPVSGQISIIKSSTVLSIPSLLTFTRGWSWSECQSSMSRSAFIIIYQWFIKFIMDHCLADACTSKCFMSLLVLWIPSATSNKLPLKTCKPKLLVTKFFYHHVQVVGVAKKINKEKHIAQSNLLITRVARKEEPIKVTMRQVLHQVHRKGGVLGNLGSTTQSAHSSDTGRLFSAKGSDEGIEIICVRSV